MCTNHIQVYKDHILVASLLCTEDYDVATTKCNHLVLDIRLTQHQHSHSISTHTASALTQRQVDYDSYLHLMPLK